jgi:hypothetical protein
MELCGLRQALEGSAVGPRLIVYRLAVKPSRSPKIDVSLILFFAGIYKQNTFLRLHLELSLGVRI